MVKMAFYKVKGFKFSEDGKLEKTVTVSGLIKDGIDFVGCIFRRHPELRACSDQINIDKTPFSGGGVFR